MKTIKGYDLGASGLVTIADFGSLKSSTQFPFLLVIPQTVTERVLGEHVRAAGINVLRPLKAVGIQPDQHDKEYTRVLFESGQTVKARYVIGADGARSAVSYLYRLPFTLILIVLTSLDTSSCRHRVHGSLGGAIRTRSFVRVAGSSCLRRCDLYYTSADSLGRTAIYLLPRRPLLVCSNACQ